MFNRQDWNESKSGSGHVEDIEGEFDKTIKEFDINAETVKVRGRSSEFKRSDLLKFNEGYRVFRVDGSHTHEDTMYDLCLASSCLVKGGFVLVDDVFKPSWPDVCAAVCDVIKSDILVPVAIWKSEVMLCRPEDRKYIQPVFDHIRTHYTKTWMGHGIGIFCDNIKEQMGTVRAAALIS